MGRGASAQAVHSGGGVAHGVVRLVVAEGGLQQPAYLLFRGAVVVGEHDGRLQAWLEEAAERPRGRRGERLDFMGRHPGRVDVDDGSQRVAGPTGRARQASIVRGAQAPARAAVEYRRLADHDGTGRDGTFVGQGSGRKDHIE